MGADECRLWVQISIVGADECVTPPVLKLGV